MTVISRTGRYLSFDIQPKYPGWKTDRWLVHNRKNGEILGCIEWHRPWRQHCYFQEPSVIMSAGCLEEIVSFLKEIKR